MKSDQLLAELIRGDPSHEEMLARLGKSNPFCTLGYARAMQALGREVWIVGLQSNPSEWEAGLGFITKGRLSVELEFPSAPAIAHDSRFWEVVDRLCKRAGVTDLVAGSFGSTPFDLPTLRGEISRRTRQEFVLQLTSADLASRLGSNHKRNVKKAEKAGVTIRRTRESLEWLSDHIALMSHSAERRIARGESVSMGTDTMPYRALMENGAAELFQATLGTNVLSSVFVLLSTSSGYYESAGSSADGMNTGASHFLIHQITKILREEGRETFNLGGAAEGSSLARFKLGFGPETLVLPAATCYVGPIWKRKLRSAIQLVRSDREQLVRVLTGSSSRLLVFRLETEAWAPPVAPVGEARLEPLNEEQLVQAASTFDDPDFQNRQLERLRRFGKSYAYGVYVGTSIAHVSWLLPPSAVAADLPAVLELEDGEAEITGCETAPAFRGQGLYGYAIQSIAGLARDQGIRRIYMKTLDANVASLRGIQKAGLTPIGSVRLIHPPLLPSRTLVRRALAKRPNS